MTMGEIRVWRLSDGNATVGEGGLEDNDQVRESWTTRVRLRWHGHDRIDAEVKDV
jgi:hypothetical protein